MATKAYVESLLNALPSDNRYPIRSAFWYLMDNWRIGADVRAENAQWYRVQSTTASVANSEFQVSHGLGSAPSNVMQIVDPSVANSQFVKLKVTRAADANFLYFSSDSTSAVITLLVEP